MSLTNNVKNVSRLIDQSYPPDLDTELALYRRVVKVGEEAGEVIGALGEYVGENPRKFRAENDEALRQELLDTALAALGAYEHVTGNRGESIDALEDHAKYVLRRLMNI